MNGFLRSLLAALAVVGATLITVGCGSPGEVVEPADLVLKGGKVVTMDDAVPEGEAIAISGYRIVAVGSDEEMMILDLTQARTWGEIVSLVGDAARTAKPGEWIEGRGWHQEKWDTVPTPNVDGVPLHHGLSKVSPENPVNLRHASGHASMANARAMELADISATTPDPAGGTIVRDASGSATGLLRETAQRLVGAAISKSREGLSEADRTAEFERIVELAGQEALSKGVTSFQDAGADFATIDGFRGLADEGRLPVRLYVMVRRESNETMAERLPDYRIIPEGNDFLAVRSIKRQIDGALGAHGAWMLEPYEDKEGDVGLVLEPVADIEATAKIAIENGFQVNTHAIGDRANREVLDIYERTFATSPDKTDLRWRVEHAQHVHPDDLPRFAELGVVAAMQGIHCTSDGPWVPKRIGAERAQSGAYMWRTLLDSGAVVGNGTDCPVEDIDPIASFHASVTRQMANGELFYPDQKMTRMEALRSYTMGNAHAAFEEHLKGSLTPGKLADVVVLSKDIMTIPEEEIPTARVDYTIIGGEVRFER